MEIDLLATQGRIQLARKNSFNLRVNKKLTIETHWFTMKLCHDWKYSEQAMAQLSPAMEGQQGWSVQGKCKKQQFYAREIKKHNYLFEIDNEFSICKFCFENILKIKLALLSDFISDSFTVFIGLLESSV